MEEKRRQVMVIKTQELQLYFDNKKEGYEKTEDGYKCKVCGETILARPITHPVWDGPFAMCGSGSCEKIQHPYCPKCETQPKFREGPIAPQGSYHNPIHAEIISTGAIIKVKQS